MEPFGCAIDDFRAGIGPAIALGNPAASMELFPWNGTVNADEIDSPEEQDRIFRRDILGERDG